MATSSFAGPLRVLETALLTGVKTVSGTVSVTSGSTTVTGGVFIDPETGEQFEPSFTTELASGDSIRILGVWYTVATVVSATEIRLTETYTGADASDLQMEKSTLAVLEAAIRGLFENTEGREGAEFVDIRYSIDGANYTALVLYVR